MEQRNPNAAVQGLQGEGLYSRFAAADAANELRSNVFATQQRQAGERLSDRVSQHSRMHNLQSDAIKDAESGAKIGTILGLGQVGLGIQGAWDAKKDLLKKKRQQQQLIDATIAQASPEGLSNLYRIFSDEEDWGDRLRNTSWYKSQNFQF